MPENSETPSRIDNAIQALAGLIQVASTAMVNLHYAATIDPDQIEYARADLRDLRASLDQALGFLGGAS